MCFLIKEGSLRAVLRQPFVMASEPANLDDIESGLSYNGLQSTKNNDYRHETLGLILEDMHDENVLQKESLLFSLTRDIIL